MKNNIIDVSSRIFIQIIKMHTIILFLILIIFVSGKINYSKEFSIELLNHNTSSIESTINTTKLIFEYIKKNNLLPECKFDYSFKKINKVFRNDMLFDTQTNIISNQQAKLRLRIDSVDKTDLTFKYSSLLKQIVQNINAESSDKYKSETKIEQNVYTFFFASK
jgi:hypothetical protein